MGVQSFKFNDMEWSLWDRWVLEGDLTVQQVLDWFKVTLRSQCFHVAISEDQDFGMLRLWVLSAHAAVPGGSSIEDAPNRSDSKHWRWTNH